MTDLSGQIEKAADAMLDSDKLEGYKPDTLDAYGRAARAALSAFHDPECSALRSLIRTALVENQVETLDGQARAVLTAISRALSEQKK